jgi:glycosyltransferase involved in cell wall biosynthesis
MISIIIPVYNVSSYIEQCLLSISLQTYTQFEIILIDDGSSDDSFQKCLDFKTKWKNNDIIIFQKENGGVTAARKDGVKLAKGNWVTFVDGDDTLPPNALESLVNSVKSNVGIVLGAHCRKYSHGEIEFWPNKSLGEFSAYDYIKINLRGAFEGAPWGKLFKRKLLADYIFDLPREIHTREDIIMNMRIALNNPDNVVFVDDVVYNYTWLREDSAVNVFLKKFDLQYEFRTVDYQVSSLTDKINSDEFKSDIATLYMRYLWSWKKKLFVLKKQDFRKIMKIQKYIFLNNKKHLSKLLLMVVFITTGRLCNFFR